MMDPKLLRKKSFIFLCFGGFLIFVGFLIPYVFIQDRNIAAGLNPQHCSFLVTVIGGANAIGRLVLGGIACKVEPLNVYVFSMFITGIVTILSDLSQTLSYQYLYCFVFGFFVSCATSLRSMVIVSLYGLDNLTNATGVILVFQGLGTLVSTPGASILKNMYGFSVAFYVAGIFITAGGIILLPVKSMSEKEKKVAQLLTSQPPKTQK